MANETKIITVSDQDDKPKRESAQMMKNFAAAMQEIVQRNITKNVNKTYTQYSKDTVKGYLKSPASSLSNIVQVSRFLERNSSLYRKILAYYAFTPLFYYNIVQDNDLSKTLNANKISKDYYSVVKQFNSFNIAKEMQNAIYCTVRDGMFVGFLYGSEDNAFFMPLDITYCRIRGKNEAGEWVVYFDASFFKNGENKMFVEGINGDTSACWDQVFVDGWEAYKQDSTNGRFFRLPTERAFCMIAGSDDQFDVPLPLYANLMTDIMSLEDLADLFESKSELENYKLLVSKIPLFKDTNETDDFSISIELAKYFNTMLESEVPDLVAAVTSPMELDVIDFNKSNKTDDSDMLAQSTQNLFNNAGVSQIVVAGGLSSNSIGLKYSLQNDLSNIFYYVSRIESWLNYYIKTTISEGYQLQIHRISWLNAEEYQSSKKDIATLGGSALDMLTSYGDTPYIALQKLNFEAAIGLKSLMTPLQTSYTQSSSNNSSGRPEKDETELTEEGLKTKEGNKNGNTKANG